MSAHLGKIALMVVMSHGLRALGKASSPRWAGLALGLPCSTAVALVGGGFDRGVDYAVVMSGTSLIGLAGAVALPVAYARGVLRGWPLPGAIVLGVASYLVVAFVAGRVLPGRGDASLGLALLSVSVAALLAGRIPQGKGADQLESRPSPAWATRLLRTAVPIACLAMSLGMGEIFGPELAGLMSTFPGVTLTVLCLTHLESGPAAALRMARALPAGNLGMVAFLAVFRFGCPNLGLAWGTTSAYLAALATLTLVVASGQLRRAATEGARRARDLATAWASREDRPEDGPAWPRQGRRFSPLIETFAT